MTDHTNEDDLYAALFGPAPVKEYTDEEESIWSSLYGPVEQTPMTDEERALYFSIYDYSNSITPSLYSSND